MFRRPTTYDLYLYGANFDGTRGAAFVVANTGTPLNGISATMNPYAASGSGPLTNFVLGTSYVVYQNVTPDASGRIAITWGAVSNIYSGLTGEGDFNGLQLVPSVAVPAAPSIVQQPFNSAFPGGATATLFADGRGNPAVSYQWYRVSPPGPVSGQTSNTLTFANFQSAEAGSYYVVVTNSGGSITSSVVRIVADTTPSVVAQSPAGGVTQATGHDLALSVSTFGATPLTYYWESNGVVVAVTSNGAPSTNNNGSLVDFNATASSATISNISATCTLSCVVSNSLGAATNIPVVVTVVPQLTGPFAAVILSNNPVGYWPLNETGTVAINYGSAGAALNGLIRLTRPVPILRGPLPKACQGRSIRGCRMAGCRPANSAQTINKVRASAPALTFQTIPRSILESAPPR